MAERIARQGKDFHNFLVARIEEAGFDVPRYNEVTGLRVGHVHPKNVGENYPDFDGHPLPVAYVHYGCFDLVNEDNLKLKKYHDSLRCVSGSMGSLLSV